MLILHGLWISVVKFKTFSFFFFFPSGLLILHHAGPEWLCLKQGEQERGRGKMCLCVSYLISSPTCTR